MNDAMVQVDEVVVHIDGTEDDALQAALLGDPLQLSLDELRLQHSAAAG